MADQPALQKTDLVTFGVKVDGTLIPGHYGVSKVEVFLALNKIPQATVYIDDGDPSEETFALSESSEFLPGAEIEVLLGYHNQEKSVFKGIIVSHGLQVKTSGRSSLVVRCSDKAAKLTIGRKNAYFLKSKDSDVMSKLISDAGGLTADVKATTFQHPEIIQYNSTDWDMLMTRAELNGLIVLVEGGKVSVKAPGDAAASGVSLSYGTDIIDSNLEIDARTQLAAVTCKSWDGAENKVLESGSSEPSLNSHGNITGKKLAEVVAPKDYFLHTTTPTDKSVLKTWASARLMRSRLARIQGSLRCEGQADLKPNTLLTINGLGARFNGDAYISGVTHIMEGGNWITEVEVGLTPDWFAETNPNIDTPSAAGLLPGIGGLYMATVKKIDADPDSHWRVQVDIPMIEPSGDGVWARLSQFYASKEFGAFFFPEVGDEVIVGFLQDDPRFPIILGSVYSGTKHPSEYTPDDKNTYKAFVTKSKMKLEFDDEKSIITLLTPGGKSLIIDDDQDMITLEDNHKNVVEMSSSGIAITTEKDFTVTAKGNISFEATGNVESKATGDFTAEGMNATLKGKTKFAAEGPMAEVKGSGQLTLKGGMVMIN